MAKKHFHGETKEDRKKRKHYEKLSKITAQSISIPNKDKSQIAFVCGNGNSRQGIDLDYLQSIGSLYACNAVYRTNIPDHLIAVDTKMIREITNSGYQLKNKVWTNTNRYTRTVPKINLLNPNLGWSSGPSALHLASQHYYPEIYILGFDYEGTGNNNELVNNIYAGTENYKKKGEKATYFGNWTRQTSICVQKFPKVAYYRIIPDINSFVPDTLKDLPNLKHITIENFKRNFNIK